MSFTVESKSQLAKLMATENITVQHCKVRTASFDVKNRVLRLPIWKEMTGVMYDLLCGHEIGHALYTPLEGWHDAVVKNNKGKNYKFFLNVVEDARIEKKVQRRYPGLRSSFIHAYDELFDRDFFGIKHSDINKKVFVDRLNVYTKSQYTLAVNFNEFESSLVERVKSAETWDDVVRITNDVYEYSKDEQYEQNLDDDFDINVVYDEDSEEYMDDSSEESEGMEESEGTEDGDSEGEESEETEEKSNKNSKGKKSEEDSEEEDTPIKKDVVDRFKESKESDKSDFEPDCQTDRTFRNNEGYLLDETCKDYIYIDIPTPKLENIITPSKRVHELMTAYYDERVKGEYITEKQVVGLINDFKNKNDRYVGILVKEFEMRKAAKSFAKSKSSDSGDIDINKISTYKFNDDIFRKITTVPRGKSHGLILLLDASGSMTNNMAGSIEQILVLTMFCRKVNIPFTVYSFNNCKDVKCADLNITSYQLSAQFDKDAFTKNENELCLANSRLREYLNSNMSNFEFNKAVRNMILLKSSYESYSRLHRPISESLSNTPLNESIVAVSKIMIDFKKKNNLDLTSLVIVHDGDSDNTSRFYNSEKTYYGNMSEFSHKRQNVIFQDKKIKFQKKLEVDTKFSSNQICTEALMEWFKKATGSNIVGFFIMDGYPSNVKHSISNRYIYEDNTSVYTKFNNSVDIDEAEKKLHEQFKVDKYLSSNNKGYTKFFFVAGGSDMSASELNFDVDGSFSASKLKNAFLKANIKRQVSRALVSKFIETIAI